MLKDFLLKAYQFQIDLNIAHGKSHNLEVFQYYQYDMKGFFADIGGLLGLLLGASLLSLYDLIVAFAIHFRKKVSNWREKRRDGPKKRTMMV